MPRPLRKSELVRATQQLADHANWLNSQLFELLRRLDDYSAGPTGNAGPKPKNAVADPTGRQAIDDDIWTRERQQLSDSIRVAASALAEANRIRRHVLEPPPAREPADRGIPRCANIHGCDAFADVAGRCRPCYDYRRKHDTDRRCDAGL